MPFESGVVSDYWGSSVTVPLYQYNGKGDMTECKN